MNSAFCWKNAFDWQALRRSVTVLRGVDLDGVSGPGRFMRWWGVRTVPAQKHAYAHRFAGAHTPDEGRINFCGSVFTPPVSRWRFEGWHR